MSIYRFIARAKFSDPRAEIFLSDARALGFNDLRRITCHDLYFVEGQLSQEICKRLALELLTDPVTQSITWTKMPAAPAPASTSGPDMPFRLLDPPLSASPERDSVMVEVALRPGVTDPVAEQIVRASRELGLDGVCRAATGMRFLLKFNESASVRESMIQSVVERLLANNVIQQWTIGEITPSFPEETGSSGVVETIPVRGLHAEALLTVSKERLAALDLAEMRAIQEYFEEVRRDPTDVEFEAIAQTWSEHCGHKTFKGRIGIRDQRVENSEQGKADSKDDSLVSTLDSLIKTYLKSATDQINAPWVISAFVDNAGIIDFDEQFEVSFKVETHNHPSAVEPFGGANTGVGGVIRDVLGVSAKPIANTDILCFGPQNLDPASLPEGVLHPRRIQSGVVAGVQDYGNKIGIPTVNGAILYDEAYTANPLVFCGCVGIAPKGKHRKTPKVGDRVIVIGGRTGRDGLRGATFSSMTMDAQTGEVSGASVQIGDPITEKGLIDVIVRARDTGLYHDITDCGAGGLSSAVGEMASHIGCDVDLTRVRLKYPGLAPWEIWLSEAQERMVLAVPPKHLRALQELCERFDTDLTDIGAMTGSGRLVVRYNGQIVLDLANDFLHAGIPQRQLTATIHQPTSNFRIPNSQFPTTNLPDTLLKLLSHPNIASKSAVIRIYDHEIQGGTVVKPLTGVEMDAPSDATVLKPTGTKGVRGIVLSNGINPEYGKRDTYKMAWAAIDEAVRNAVAVGADPERIAILDNFCWGDPLRPETLGSLVEACRGCHDAALFYRTPFISGKDSLNNEYLGSDGQRHAIPPTLLISAIGIIRDVSSAITMDLKEAGNDIYLIGNFQPAFGGSHVSLLTSQGLDEPVPDVHEITPRVYKALHRAINANLIRAAHDLSEGGLGVAAAEMCIGGRLGMRLENNREDDLPRMLFGESTGTLLVEVRRQDRDKFLASFDGLPLAWLGTVTEDQALSMSTHGSPVLDVPISQLLTAWNTTL
jgi:phosphoribosylformylglycinamidine synthase